MRRIVTLVAGITLMLLTVVAPGSAIAQGSSTCQAYNPQFCTPAQSTLGNSGTLPFTGLDVVLLAAGGGVLLAGGLVVRRLSRRLD